MDKALVIVPTINEVENIGKLVSELLALRAPEAELDVLVVDDASTDGTAETVKAIAGRDGRVRLLSRPAKLGLGTAYMAGFKCAIENGYTYAATMDADFSHAPAHIPEFLRAIRDADVVIGSRYIPGGGIENWDLRRRLLSATANLMARAVGGLKPHDCTTGYRLYRTEFLRRLPLEGIRSHGYSCLIELVFVSQRHGGRIRESPIRFKDRVAGDSKISSREITRALATLYHLALRRMRRDPVPACGGGA